MTFPVFKVVLSAAQHPAPKRSIAKNTELSLIS